MIKKALFYGELLLFFSLVIAAGWCYYAKNSLFPSYQKKLTVVVEKRTQEIIAHLNEQENNAQTLSYNTVVLDALTQPSLDQKTQQELLTLCKHKKEIMHFKNIILINNKGKILFSTTKKNITNLIIDKNSQDSLNKSFERAYMTLTNDFSRFNFNDIVQEPAVFITIPILHNKKFIGALCYQLDESRIYALSHQYIGLEKTGEIALGQKDGDYVIFVAPTRNDPDIAFKKRILYSHPPLSIQAATLGEEGSGEAIDYRGEQVIGAWKFIPKIDWGMIVKIDKIEILSSIKIHYNILFVLLVCWIIYTFFLIYYFAGTIRNSIKKLDKSSFLLSLLSSYKYLIVFLLCTLLAAKRSLDYFQERYTIQEKIKQEIISTATKTAEKIDDTLKKIEFIAHEIAHDLKTGYLHTPDIQVRIQRDIKENNILQGIQIILPDPSNHNKSETFNAIQNNSNNVIDLLTTIEQEPWYNSIIEKKSSWHIPHNNEFSSKYGTYTLTLSDFQENKKSTITIIYSLDNLLQLINSMSMGQLSYPIILNTNGSFIFHPIKEISDKQITFLEYAQSIGNEELAAIAETLNTSDPSIASYTSEITKERYWLYTIPVKTNGWIIGSVVSEREQQISPGTTRQYYFWIIIYILFSLIFLFTFLWNNNYFSFIYYTSIINILLLIALLLTWFAIKKTLTIDHAEKIVISDQSMLSNFLNDLNEDAERKHEPQPIIIPCGILLSSLDFPDPRHSTFSGYIWNKYNTSISIAIERGMDLPQATSLTLGTPLLSKSNGIETVTTTLQATLSQEQNYAHYPFDQQQVQIILEHRDIEKNIILTPDLEAYKKISPENAPGLDKGFIVPGFTIEQSFFEYKRREPTTNFGFKEFGKVTDHYQLLYNILLNRNLLNPFIFYFLPLLVILFSLFATLLLTTKKTDLLTVLGTYSGLFFALVILQRSLREQYPTGATLYMEYAFFFIYITIFFLILHTIATRYLCKNGDLEQDPSLYFMKIGFWPFQFLMWLITTFIIFY